jgi:indolepyruvate ferredoxin oxidoreductase alpha subunit
MGNDAIARGALEAGVRVVAGYPGTPSSEILQTLAASAAERGLYAEWSVNEKVALEVAAAGSFAGLRSMGVMKQVGVNVASDFLLHLAEGGTRGGMVLVSCEDPGALSSTNEGDSRPYAKMMEFPLVEPGDFQEAKDLTRWCFEFSEQLNLVVMLRSVTRLSHASGNLTLGELPPAEAPAARFECGGGFMDQEAGPVVTFPSLVEPMHQRQLEKLARVREAFEDSPFNTYSGPERPELLVVTSSAAHLYAKEAVAMLGAEDRVGLLKLATTWPLPERLVGRRLAAAEKVLVVEEGTPFLEDNIKALAAEKAGEMGAKSFYGRKHGQAGAVLPSVNELNPDLVAEGMARVLGLEPPARDADYAARAAELATANVPARALTFCPGCPHRASYWLINQALKEDARQGFVCGDIGCYTLGAISCGFNALKTSHAMGSGAGVASGFGQLGRFGLDQPVMAICGDSTFFHAVLPALVNAVHNQADMILVVVDNSGTAMTGFQPHPGTPSGAGGAELPAVDIPAVCRAVGAEVVIADPFELTAAGRTVREVVGDAGGVRVLVLRQACALSPGKKGKRLYEMTIDPAACLGQECGCNRLCTRVFRCPGLIWDAEEGVTRIDEVICAGCGVCADICPAGAITKEVA